MRKYPFITIFTVISILFCMMHWVQPVSAEETASLTLNCIKDEKIVSGMEWRLYYVAKVDGDNIHPTKTFRRYQVSVGDKSQNAMSDLANTLYYYTVTDDISPMQTGITDKNGLLTFSGLETGLYMLVGKKLKIDYLSWETEPLLLNIDTAKEYDINAYPKMRYATLNEGEIEYTVRKIWANDETQPWLRTVYITAELYRDGKFDREIKLDAQNIGVILGKMIQTVSGSLKK